MEPGPEWDITSAKGWTERTFEGWFLTPNDGRQLIMNLPDGSISIGCIPLGGYGSRVSITVRPDDLDELIAALMEVRKRTQGGADAAPARGE